MPNLATLTARRPEAQRLLHLLIGPGDRTSAPVFRVEVRCVEAVAQKKCSAAIVSVQKHAESFLCCMMQWLELGNFRD